MHIEIKGTAFLEEAEALGAAADQLPFIMSVALNRAAKDTREYLIHETWPASVQVRNPAFLGHALRTNWSSKHDLTVSIFDQLGRGSLKAHADGGVKVPKGRNLAIPNKRNVRLTAHGVPASQKPRNIRGVRLFDQIFEIRGRGKARHLVPMFILRPRVVIKKDVPFRADFESQMRTNIRSHLPRAVIDAMRTRR